jgi:uncharacterized membrane protein
MTKLTGTLVLLAFGAVIVFYVLRSYRAMRPAGGCITPPSPI